MKNYVTALVCAAVALLNVGCSVIDTQLEENTSEKELLKIHSIIPFNNYKNLTVNISLDDSITQNSIIPIDSIKVVPSEWNFNRKTYLTDATPTIQSIEYIKAQLIDEKGMKALVLLDLTVPEAQLEQQRAIVKNLRHVYAYNNLYVAFMYDGKTTQSIPVTDYVVENYIVSKPSDKHLFSSIVTKCNELRTDTVWRYVDPHKKALIVLSDGKTYHNNVPMDKYHFAHQRDLLKLSEDTLTSPIYYIQLNAQQPVAAAKTEGSAANIVGNEAENIMRITCNNTRGHYLEKFIWTHLSQELLQEETNELPDIRILLENPDKKVYRGFKRILNFDLYYQNQLMASGSRDYVVGSLYNPIIVNGRTNNSVMVRGFFVFLMLVVSLYGVFQYLVPYLSYRWFKYRYVTEYKGLNMTFNNNLVGDVCYMCKAPFKVGDKIVAKCEHTVHESCWNENEYKCPEYGRHCKTGSHYYNQQKLYDKRNAPYYLNWLLAGSVAGLLSWLLYILKVIEVGYSFITPFLLKLFNITANSAQAAEFVSVLGDKIYYTPYYGLYTCFFLTLLLSILSNNGGWRLKRVLFVVSKAVLAAICGYLSFILVALVSLSFSISGSNFLVDWIPWILNAFVVVFAVSFGTNIKLKRALIGAAIAAVFSLVSMLMWNLMMASSLDARDLLMYINFIYCLAMSLSISVNSPKSERYMLRVEGPIKTTYIALYKWINSSYATRKVTIGKSVDCNLQMSWDINSNIAPLQAELVSQYGNMYLVAIENNGVKIKHKYLKEGARVRLYHGDQFTIGNTLFTYVEQDV